MDYDKLEEPPFDIAKDRMFTTGQIIKILKISRSTLSRWIKTGYFPKPNYFVTGPRWTEFRFKAFLEQCVKDAQGHGTCPSS